MSKVTDSIYVLPNGLSKNYLKDLKNAALKANLSLSESFNKNLTTVVVSSVDDYEKIRKFLKLTNDDDGHNNITVVNLQWIIDCNKAGCLLNVHDVKYLIGPKSKIQFTAETINDSNEFGLTDYECQRATPLVHYNHEFTDALEILEKFAMYRGTENDASRSLAFRRGICVLRSLPRKIKSVKDLKNLKNIGEHTRSVVQSILDFGHCEEADSIVSSEYYQSMQMFSLIYGCGSVTANRLYELGYRTINDLRLNHSNLTKKVETDFERFKYGLAYYEDLTTHIVTDEAFHMYEIIKQIILEINSECMMEIVGGFRRGKSKGHDIDILITHPNSGEEIGLIEKIIEVLEDRGHIIDGKHDKASETDWTIKRKQVHDHFERFISILRFNKKTSYSLEDSPKPKRLKTAGINNHFEDKDKVLLNEILSSLDASKVDRNWIARRVDIIVCPIEQYAFALLGWTGSKHFNRSIRLYSDKEFNYRLSSHGIYDFKNDVKLSANTEKDIFDILKLKYLEPFERNC